MRYRDSFDRRGREYERQLAEALLDGRACIEELRQELEYREYGFDRDWDLTYTITVRMQGNLRARSREERELEEIESRNRNAALMQLAEVDRMQLAKEDCRPVLDRFMEMVKVIVRAWASDETTARYGNLDL